MQSLMLIPRLPFILVAKAFVLCWSGIGHFLLLMSLMTADIVEDL